MRDQPRDLWHAAFLFEKKQPLAAQPARIAIQAPPAGPSCSRTLALAAGRGPIQDDKPSARRDIDSIPSAKLPGIGSAIAMRWWRDENGRRAQMLVALFALLVLATVGLYLTAVLD